MSLDPKIWIFLLGLFNVLGYHFASAAYYCNYYYGYCYYYYYYYYYSSYSSAGTIAGAVIGSIIFLVIVAVFHSHYGQAGYMQPPPSYGQLQSGFNQYNQYPPPPGGNPAYPPPPPPQY